MSNVQTYEDFLRGQAEKAQYGVVIIPARTALDMADFIERTRANGTDINVGSTISRDAAIKALMKRDKELRNINWYDKPFAEGECRGIDYALEIVNALPPAQPEPEIYWGYTYERPLEDVKIVPRLRAIQRQVGGSYAIDRAIEIIEAVAERRSDGN